jgi:transposase
MEACASAHYWAREIAAVGHDTRLIPPAYVNPFVKRQKNDMADAEAICEAAQRPTMRFVQGKSAQAQASVVFRTRDLLVRQRTQLINALRGHLTEFGYIVRQGVGHIARLVEIIGDVTSDVPAQARPVLTVIAQSLQTLQAQIALLDREIANRAKADPVAKRLMTIPGVGPVTATALVALAPAASTFRRGRDFAAWLGLVPRQHSSGGKERLGRTTKMGERSLRRLLILGASSATKVAARDPDKAGAWLASMLTRKPRMLVTVALANRMARTVWALMAHGGSYRAPAAAV